MLLFLVCFKCKALGSFGCKETMTCTVVLLSAVVSVIITENGTGGIVTAAASPDDIK